MNQDENSQLHTYKNRDMTQLDRVKNKILTLNLEIINNCVEENAWK